MASGRNRGNGLDAALAAWRALSEPQRQYIILGIEMFAVDTPKVCETIEAALALLRAAAEPEEKGGTAMTAAMNKVAEAIVALRAEYQNPNGINFVEMLMKAFPDLLALAEEALRMRAEVERLESLWQLECDRAANAEDESFLRGRSLVVVEARVAQLEAGLRLARDQMDMQRNEQAYDAINAALETKP